MEIEIRYIIIIIGLFFLFSPFIKLRLIQYGILKPKINPIIEIVENGIEIAHPKSKSSESINWIELTSIELLSNNKTLKLAFKNKTERVLKDKEYSNWADILKAVPNGLKNDAITTFSREYFKDLKTCKVCGKIAVKDDDCLHCSSDQDLDDLKQKQLFWFSIEDKNEKIDFFYKDFVYETDNDWKPIITKNDVLNYSLTD